MFAVVADVGVEEIANTSALSLTSQLRPSAFSAFLVLPVNQIGTSEVIFVLSPLPEQQLLFPPRDLSILAVMSNSVTLQWSHLSGRNIIMVGVYKCVCYKLHLEPV